MSTRRSPRREQGSREHLSPQAPGRLHGEGEGRRAQPQVSTRVGVQRLVTAAPLPSSPLPRALNSLGGDDDTGMPIRAWGDESHADVLPKLCVVTPASDGTQGGAEGQQGAHGRTRSIGNSRQFLIAPDGYGANFRPQEAAPRSPECPRQGLSSSQNTGVTAAGCAILAAAVL